MLLNMFVGKPPGNYDRLLDFSRAVTGTLFFVPSTTFLENVSAGVEAPSMVGLSSNGRETQAKSKSQPSPPNGSLRIGSLKKEAEHE
jgi:porphyrinogen peroxidase